MKKLYVCLNIVVAFSLASIASAEPKIASVKTHVVEDESVTASEVDPQFFLTTFSEIQDLPEKDQKKYIQELREIAKGFPRDLLTTNGAGECPRDQVLCQPPLFGSGTCVAKEKFDFAVCGQRSSDQKLTIFFREPSSESFWDDFEKKVASYCDNSAHSEKCKKLEDLRIKLFMTRKSH